MRICWFLPDDYKGGMFPVVNSVCALARKAGHDSHVLLLCPPGKENTSANAPYIHSLKLEPNAPDAPERILSWISEHDIETLVLNGCEEADPVIPYLPENVRCIYAIHDTARWYWTQAIRFQAELDGIVAVSDAVARKVQPFVKNPAKLVIVPNGTSFPIAPLPDEVRPDDLLFVGGDDPMKGIGDAMRVWENLQRWTFRGRLHWCGDADADFVKRLDQLPGRANLVFHGRVSRAKIFELASQTKVLLAPTRAESFGMVTLEAMSMGCVPVAWDIETGTKTLIQPDVHGYFVPLGDYETFASAVLKAIYKYAELSPATILRARSHFTEDAMWGGYERVITNCRANGGVSRPLAGKKPPRFQARPRLGRILPRWVWEPARALITNSPKMAYMFRDLRRL